MKRCARGHYYDEQKYDHCPRCDVEDNDETVAIDTDRKIIKKIPQKEKHNGYNEIPSTEQITRGSMYVDNDDSTQDGHPSNGYASNGYVSNRYPSNDYQPNKGVYNQDPYNSQYNYPSAGYTGGDYPPTTSNYYPPVLGGYDAARGEETIGLYTKVKGFNPVVGWLVCIDGIHRGKDFIIRPERNFIGRDPGMDICITGDNTISANRHAIISYNPKESVFRIIPGDGRGIVYLNNREVFNAEPLKRGDVIQIGQTNMIFIPLCGEEFTW